jgi:hypothetical protein
MVLALKPSKLLPLSLCKFLPNLQNLYSFSVLHFSRIIQLRKHLHLFSHSILHIDLNSIEFLHCYKKLDQIVVAAGAEAECATCMWR